jgi:hypothetical protein
MSHVRKLPVTCLVIMAGLLVEGCAKKAVSQPPRPVTTNPVPGPITPPPVARGTAPTIKLFEAERRRYGHFG